MYVIIRALQEFKIFLSTKYSLIVLNRYIIKLRVSFIANSSSWRIEKIEKIVFIDRDSTLIRKSKWRENVSSNSFSLSLHASYARVSFRYVRHDMWLSRSHGSRVSWERLRVNDACQRPFEGARRVHGTRANVG